MIAILRPAIIIFVLLSMLTGIIYPLAITGIAQAVFPHQANGSIIMQNGKAVGSSLIGQDFSTDAKYFWGRLSATSPVPYTAFNADKSTGSSGSNLGPTNSALLDNATARIEALHAAEVAVGLARPTEQAIPIDLVTASASGLDPHISMAAAEYQIPRVARARSVSDETVRSLVRQHTESRLLGVLGEPVVNVLDLNLALEQAIPSQPLR